MFSEIGIIYSIIQALLIFAVSPFIIGLMNKIKARSQSRRGAPILQPYFDIAKLFMKGTVVSSTTSWIFMAAPAVLFASIIIAAAVLPIIFQSTFVAIDLILFVYIFAIGRFMMYLAALDAGSAFGGIGASREAFYSALLEPVIFAIIIFFSFSNGFGSIASVSSTTSLNWQLTATSPAFWLTAGALFIVILAETGRLPFDNPSTHLELTMVHEAMVLEYSGPMLALIEWANASKMVVFFGLFVVLFLPINAFVSSSNVLFSGLMAFAGILLLAISTAIIESISPKVRLFKVTKLLAFSLVLSLLAVIVRFFNGPQVIGPVAVLSVAMLVSAIYFLFSATFMRRLEIFILQSMLLALILLFVLSSDGGAGTYLQLVSTIIFKIMVLPYLIYAAFRRLAGNSKVVLDADPLFLRSHVGTVGSLVLATLLIFLSYSVSYVLGIGNPLFPIALSIILIGGLIMATKTHVMLQLMGFLVLENGLVLFPIALSIQIPIIEEIVSIFDVIILVAVALLLFFKINNVIASLDTVRMNQLSEER